jgi:ribosomal protein S18 acetylase RimI-like enzyme
MYDFEPQPSMKLSSGGYVSFRPFQASDREQVQGLHEEWFPVRYKQEFYDDLVHQRMFNSGEELFTYAAIYHDDNEDPGHVQSCSSWCSSSQDSTSKEDSVVACVVGSFLEVSCMDNTTTALLISSPSRYTRLFYVMTLGTVTEFRHARLATTLIKKCIEIVENDSQCGALYLHVITFNTAAIRFYERLGFYRVNEIEGKSNRVEHPLLILAS